MLVSATAAFFRYKLVRSVIVLACWDRFEQIKLVREISEHGFTATVACTPAALGHTQRHGLQGVLYFNQPDDGILGQVKPDQFSGSFVWLVVGGEVPAALHHARYDADVTLLRGQVAAGEPAALLSSNETVYLDDIYVHPSEGASLHPWGYWSNLRQLVVPHDRRRTLRRLNLRGYPLRIAAPRGQYSEQRHRGTFERYLAEDAGHHVDAGIRCGYAAAALVLQLLNATEVLIMTELWSSTINNSSMTLMLQRGDADLSGAFLRILTERLGTLEYIMPIWPFSVGFTYLAERESSGNMFAAPFTGGVWLACLGIVGALAAAQRAAARTDQEKDGAFCAVLATFLQQDASAVPRGASGRGTFVAAAACAMLLHAYYTSAVLSALVGGGAAGPAGLRPLADSKYAIASEDYAYMRYLFFDVKTNWDDLEYLKKKKMTPEFYQELKRGVELVREGTTAFHTEYNQIYPHFKTFTDDQICKLQKVDTVPETMTWMTGAARGQFGNTFRAAGARLLEAGLRARLAAGRRARPPPCRAQLLAERLGLGDVRSLLALTAAGALLSLALLALEILVAKKIPSLSASQNDGVVFAEYGYMR